jgi:hypothetical protein
MWKRIESPTSTRRRLAEEINMALQEKKLTETVRTVTAAKGKHGWETIPMGRVLHWFTQAPLRPESTANRPGIALVKDIRSVRSQVGRRKVL